MSGARWHAAQWSSYTRTYADASKSRPVFSHNAGGLNLRALPLNPYAWFSNRPRPLGTALEGAGIGEPTSFPRGPRPLGRPPSGIVIVPSDTPLASRPPSSALARTSHPPSPIAHASALGGPHLA